MRFAKIPKRRGGYRTICMPGRRQKQFLRRLLRPLERIAADVSPDWVVHGFYPGRSPVSNARQHVGYRYSVCMDLSAFFDSVRPVMIEGTGAAKYIRFVFIMGRAWQGLPTSPVIANIAARHLDRLVLDMVRDLPGYANYTRYADDLTISFNERDSIAHVLRSVTAIVKNCGFKVNRDKTEVLCAANGRRHITGVAVDDKGVYPTRKMKRRLRAAEHQKNVSAADGLREWCRCPAPKAYMNLLSAAHDSVVEAISDVDMGD